MGTKVNYMLREPQMGVPAAKQKKTPVIMFFNFGYFEIKNNGEKRYMPLKYSTGETIKPMYWNFKAHRAKQTRSFDYNSFNLRLENIKGAATSVYNNLLTRNTRVTPEKIRDALNKELGRDTKKFPNTLALFTQRFINECKDGTRTTDKRSTHYSSSFIKSLVTFLHLIEEYEKNENIKLWFDDITFEFFGKFKGFLNKKNYSPNSQRKQIKILKLILRAAKKLKLHNNNEYESRDFTIKSVEAINISLDESELKRMQELNLSDKPNYERARDVFLVGCYTAQRFSDYSRIRKEHIKKGKIHLKQRKTGVDVVIPIKPELSVLLKKYDFTLPKIYEQKLNKYIKEVGRLAGIDEAVTIVQEKGGMKVDITRPKYEFIKTHTARRSGCTNMVEAEVPLSQIMKISGHKTGEEFWKYVKLDANRSADKAAKHPYFREGNLKVAK